MKVISISGKKRDTLGTSDAKNQRKKGLIPCVLYGGKEQIHFIAEEKSFKNLIYTPEVLAAELDIEGKKVKAILQDAQFHPVTDKLLHADFLELDDNKPVAVALPIKITGNSIGVRQGGKLIAKMRKIKVKALPKDLPENIEVDITNLKMSESIKVQDISNDKVEFLEAPNTVIATVKMTRAAAQEAKAAEKGKK